MKEKIKKFFTKDNLFILICTLLIGLFVLLSVLYYKKDVDNSIENNQANINIVNDENNLNTSWSINNEGNLVGNNLFNSSTFVSTAVHNASYTFDNASIMMISSSSDDPFVYGTFSVEPNTAYTISINIIQGTIQSWGINPSYLVAPSRTSISFNTNSDTTTYPLCFECYEVDNYQCTIQIMLNYGSSSLPWEPYGVWYSQTNYDNLQTQYDIILANINPLSANNISSNSLILNSVDVTSQLGGSIFLSNLNGGLGFYNYDFDAYSSFNSSGVNVFNLVSNFNNTYSIFGCSAFVSLSRSAEDYLDISFYRDNQLILSMNDLDSETTQEYMQTYSNQEIQFNKIIISGQYTSGVSNRQGVNYIIDNNNYAFGYQQGYKDSEMFYDSENTRLVAENSQLTNDLNNLNNNYNSLNTNYNNLLSQYNNLANNEYTFSELFWSISSVPFGVLASGFNVNVLGVNLAAIITGLFTALLIIWIIKWLSK